MFNLSLAQSKSIVCQAAFKVGPFVTSMIKPVLLPTQYARFSKGKDPTREEIEADIERMKKEIKFGKIERKEGEAEPLFEDAWVTKLSNRSVLSVRGRDATDLLQNVITADMSTFETDGEDRAAIYTAFLNVKGKVLFDAMIVKPKLASQTKDDMEYWVDIHEDDIGALRKLLHRYAMRKNI
jgi:glycine cleavage system aminomethyltransferase T